MRIAFIAVEPEPNKITGTNTIAYLLSYLEQFFPDDLLFPAHNSEFILKTKPDIVGVISDYSYLLDEASKIAALIKEKLKIPVILLGKHISNLPESLPWEFNLGIIGEPEETVCEILKLFESKKELNPENLAEIRGIAFRNKTKIINTCKRKLIENLDTLASCRKFFYNMPGNWIPSLVTGRGYSLNTNVSDCPVRMHSAERLIGECIDIITYFPDSKTVFINDPYLLHDPKRFQRFAEIAGEVNLKKYFGFEITALPEQLNEEIIYTLCNKLNTHTLNLFLPTLTQKIEKEKYLKIFEFCYKFGLNIVAHFTLGYPSETKNDIAHNYWFIREKIIKPFNNVRIKTKFFVPQPGTDNWSKAKLKKIIPEKINNWKILDEYNLSQATPMMNKFLKFEELLLINENFLALNPRTEIINSPVLDKFEQFQKQQMEVTEKIINDFKNIYSEIEAPELYRYSDKLQKTNIINTRVNLSVTRVIENCLENHPLNNLFIYKDSIINIFNNFQQHNHSNRVNTLLYNKDILTLAIPDILEMVIKDNTIKSILQITDPLLNDLSNILFRDNFEIDNLVPSVFNNHKSRLNLDKKYDCIILFFTLDMVRQPFRVLKYCYQVLNTHGSLIISFFNAKSIFLLEQIISNKNLNKLFYNYNKLNFFSYKSMVWLLSKNNFIPKKSCKVIYPEKTSLSYFQCLLTKSINKSFHKQEEGLTTFCYTFSCRKH